MAPKTPAALVATGGEVAWLAAGWTVEHHPVLASTQTRARECPPWTAVIADVQTAGRGQGPRSFVSDAGGLYLTAVLPYAGDALKARGFALAVGWAVRERLQRAGVRRLRLRWPNDLMVGSRKVGGILVEQGGPATLCVGLGLNLSNEPWRADPTLSESAGRLDDLAAAVLPPRPRMVELLLRAFRVANTTFAQRRLAGFVPLLNRCWGDPRRVVLELAEHGGQSELTGVFDGIDGEGRVLLRTAEGTVGVPEHHIRRLREVQ